MENKGMMPLSIGETARLLAVSPRTVRRLIDRGELSAVRIGASLAVPADGLPAALRHCFGSGCPQALLTLHEVAARLGCSPRDVRERTAAGLLKSVLDGRSARWPLTEIQNTVRTGGPA